MRLASLLTSNSMLIESYDDPSKTGFYLTYSESTHEWSSREIVATEGVKELLLEQYEDSSLGVIRQGLLQEREVSLIPRLGDLLIKINRIVYSRLLIFHLTVEPSEEQTSAATPILFRAKIQEWNAFSNFFPTLLHYKDEIEDRIYPSLETVYQAVKFRDPALRKSIAAIEDPLRAMKAAKAYETADSVLPGWNEGVKERLMAQLLEIKFAQNSDLQRRLLMTYPRPLVEHTPNPFWGDGTHNDFKPGRGLNKLGHLLVALRDRMIRASASAPTPTSSIISASAPAHR